MSAAPPDSFLVSSSREEARRLVRLAIPVVGTQLSTMLLGVVDTVMLGWYDVHAMAAALAANVFTFGTLFFANGILFGLDPVVAQAHGSGQGARAGLACQRGLVLAALLGLPVALSWFLTDDFLLATGQDPQLAPLALDYVVSLMPGVPFFLAYSVLRGYLQGRELMRPALWVVVFANLFNVVANWALIFGNFGMPELGVRGAGLATSLTRIFSFALLALGIWRFRLHEGAWVPWSRKVLSPAGLGAIVVVGFPVAIQTSTEMWAFGASTLMAGTIGALALDAHGIVLNLAALSFQLPLGIAIGATTRVGNLIGAGHPEAAQRSAWVAMATGASVMVVSATLFVVFRASLPNLFTPDSAVIAFASAILPVAAAFQIFDGAQVVGCGVLRAMGRTVPAAVFNLIGYWLIGLPLGWWMGPGSGGGLEGIWWGLVIGLAIVACSLVVWIQLRGPATFRGRPEAVAGR